MSLEQCLGRGALQKGTGLGVEHRSREIIGGGVADVEMDIEVTGG